MLTSKCLVMGLQQHMKHSTEAVEHGSRSAIRDALVRTEHGQSLVVEVKEFKHSQRELEARRRQVLDLLQVVFSDRPDLIHFARTVPSTGLIIKQGGADYTSLINGLEYAVSMNDKTAARRLLHV